MFGAGEPCKCPSKRRECFADTADGLETIMTVDYCDDRNKMHIVDCEQKEESEKERFKDEFEFLNKRIDNVVEWLKTISENLVKLNGLKNSTSSKMEHVPKCDRCGEECETICFTINDIDTNKRFCPRCTGITAGEMCGQKYNSAGYKT